jgi:hypothetical protein
MSIPPPKCRETGARSDDFWSVRRQIALQRGMENTKPEMLQQGRDTLFLPCGQQTGQRRIPGIERQLMATAAA